MLDPDKYKCSGYSTGFDSRSKFTATDRSVGKNVIISGIDESSSVHIDNENKDFLILSKGSTQGLDNTTLTAKAEYSINFSRSKVKFHSGLYFNRRNNFLFINVTQIYQFKAKTSEIRKYFKRFHI